MKLVRVHNPSRIKIARKRKVKKMATRRRRTTTKRRRRAVARTRAANPRRRRRHARRRRNPGLVARASNPIGRVSNPRRRRRRRIGRRHNPSALRIGQLAKDALYGAGGAVLTRAGTQVLSNFAPSIVAMGGNYAEPIVQAAVAATVVRWAGGKFLGKQQGDVMMIGGLISAGLSLFDRVLPNLQGQIAGFAMRPIVAAPGAVIPVQGGGMGDVYDVDMEAAGFGDVEAVDLAQFNGVPGY